MAPSQPLALVSGWELRTNLTAYDALYVALAEQLDATLLTPIAALREHKVCAAAWR